MGSQTLPRSTYVSPSDTFKKSPFVGKKGKVVIVSVIGVILIAAVALALLYSPLFAARTIQVSGSRYLSKSQILAIANLSDSTPLLDVNPGGITNLLERSPWIEKAAVSVSWPAKVVIRVKEATPIGVVHLSNGSDATVGSNGKILTGSPATSSGLQFILPQKPSLTNSGLNHLSSLLSPEVAVVNTMPASLAGDISSVADSGGSGIRLMLRNGTEVVFGNSFNLREKWIALATIMAKTNINKDREIDLRDPSLVVVTP
jgi:cell division protein FtsQ